MRGTVSSFAVLTCLDCVLQLAVGTGGQAWATGEVSRSQWPPRLEIHQAAYMMHSSGTVPLAVLVTTAVSVLSLLVDPE